MHSFMSLSDTSWAPNRVRNGLYPCFPDESVCVLWEPRSRGMQRKWWSLMCHSPELQDSQKYHFQCRACGKMEPDIFRIVDTAHWLGAVLTDTVVKEVTPTHFYSEEEVSLATTLHLATKCALISTPKQIETKLRLSLLVIVPPTFCPSLYC